MLVNNSFSPCFKGYVGKNLKKMVSEGNSYDKDKKERNNDILYMMEERMNRCYSKNTVLDVVKDENGSRIVLTNPVLNKITEQTNLPNREVVVLDLGKEQNEETRKSKIASNLEKAHAAHAKYAPWGAEEIMLEGITDVAKTYVHLLDSIYGGKHDKVYKALRNELTEYGHAGENELNKLNVLVGEKPIEPTYKPTNIDDIIF